MVLPPWSSTTFFFFNRRFGQIQEEAVAAATMQPDSQSMEVAARRGMEQQTAQRAVRAMEEARGNPHRHRRRRLLGHRCRRGLDAGGRCFHRAGCSAHHHRPLVALPLNAQPNAVPAGDDAAAAAVGTRRGGGGSFFFFCCFLCACSFLFSKKMAHERFQPGPLRNYSS